MIISRIQAGLGNQFFQYATGRALAMRSNQSFKIHLSGFDMNNLTTQQKTSDIFVYRLDLFNITAELATEEEARKLKEPFGIISKRWNMFRQKYIWNYYIDFFPHIHKIKGSEYLDGYWQSERYFDDYPDIIRKEFQLKKPLDGMASNLSKQIKSNPASCFIHIRRGDYVTYGLAQDLHYFVNAISYIKKHISGVTFFVFSNDIPWAKNHLDAQGSPLTFISHPGLTPQEEMILMSHCNHAIISNSSFSWWGAWLINSTKKIVIAPKMWSKNSKDEKWLSHVVPKTWVRL